MPRTAMKVSAPFKLAAAVLITGALAACSTPGTRLRPAPVVGAAATKPGSNGGLERESHAVIKREGLEGTFRTSPAAAVRDLYQRWANDLTEVRREELAVVCAASATRIEQRDAAQAIGLRLAAAEVAWPLALAKEGRPRAIYNDQCARVAESFTISRRAGTKTLKVAGPWRSYQLRLAPAGGPRVDPAGFDEFIRSDRLVLRGLDQLDRHRTEGVGADFIGQYRHTAARAAENPLLGLAGLALPLNAVLDFGATPGRPQLTVHDMTLVTSATLAGRTVPLTADHTAPIAKLLDGVQMAKPIFDLKAMFRSHDYDELTGIYQTEPWREGQIPVILVHGLMSSPLTWLTVWNELRADPQLQARYQFLAYRYPTGYPIGRNATTFRNHLRQLREQVDPAGRNPDLRRMVLIGHSMGGILSNLQIRSSGEEIRKLFMDRELEQVDLTEEQRESLKRALYFEPNPDIRRVVFVAAPHRGSEIASNWVGRLGSRLIHLPFDVITLGLNRRPSISGTTSYGRQILARGNDSIRTLKPDNPLLTATLRLPLGRDVVYHSVIGKFQQRKPLDKSSDAVVPYWSSHLDGAASEKVVHTTHTGIVHNREAIEELSRILYQHAGLDYHK
jgi:triacylglycerol esterase/lipase EstA (alpha/beta hydrolase family)